MEADNRSVFAIADKFEGMKIYSDASSQELEYALTQNGLL